MNRLIKNSLNDLFVKIPKTIKSIDNNVNKQPSIPTKSNTIEHMSNKIPQIKVIYEINFK